MRIDASFRCGCCVFAFRLDETLILAKKCSGVDLGARFLEGSENEIFLTSKLAFRLDETLIFNFFPKKRKWFKAVLAQTVLAVLL